MDEPTNPVSNREDDSQVRARLRTELTAQLARLDPATANRLDQHPHQETLLDRAVTSLVEALREAEETIADPSRLDDLPAEERDRAEFYLQPHPAGLEATLVANMAADPDYWTLAMRYTPELMEDQEVEPETTADSSPLTT